MTAIVPPSITCMDCDGTAYPLVEYAEDAPPEPGDIVPYRCADCTERWDLVLDETDDDPTGR